MEEMKFASKSEAIQHLSDFTGKNIKIAWKDESKELLKEIAQEVNKNPASLLKLTKAAGLNFDDFLDAEDKGATIRPTNKGSIKIVQDVDPAIVKAVATKIYNTGDITARGKILDYVQSNKESFPKFHAKFKKGIEKDDSGLWRPKGGLLTTLKEKITGEKGQASDKDKAKAKKTRSEVSKEKSDAKELLETYKEIAQKSIKSNLKDDSSTKLFFEQLFKKPHLDAARSQFLKEFENEIKEDNIDKETAKKYVKISKEFTDRVKDQLKDSGLDKFVESMSKLEESIEEAALEAPAQVDETPSPSPAVDKPKFKQNPDFAKGLASDFSQEIDNMVDALIGINK